MCFKNFLEYIIIINRFFNNNCCYLTIKWLEVKFSCFNKDCCFLLQNQCFCCKFKNCLDYFSIILHIIINRIIIITFKTKVIIRFVINYIIDITIIMDITIITINTKITNYFLCNFAIIIIIKIAIITFIFINIITINFYIFQCLFYFYSHFSNLPIIHY